MPDIKNTQDLKNELIRKSIHLSSSVIPVFYLFIEREIEIIILTLFTILLIFVDILRVKSKSFGIFYLKILKPILRTHEISRDKFLLTGATYIILAFLICVIIFPKPVAITCMLITIFSDSFAAIFGKIYGKNFIKNKTIEGSLAFFISGVIIILLTPKVTGSVKEYYLGTAAVFITSLFDLIPFKVDDNILIPLFFGTVYFVLIKIFL